MGLFGGGNLCERNSLRDLSVYGRILLKWIFKKNRMGGSVNWMVLDEVRDKWQEFVKRIKTLCNLVLHEVRSIS